MKIVMPHGGPVVFEEAAIALAGAAPNARFVQMYAPHDYWRFLDELWHRGESFIIVEHDIVVTPEVISKLVRCPRPWCANPYLQLPGEPVTGLGCTKFSARLLRAVDPFDPGPTHVIWQNVDYELCSRLRAAGYENHVHTPVVRHLNPKAGDR